MKDIFPNKIPVFPLSGVIYFPNTNLPLNIFEKRYVDLVSDCMKKNKLMGMVQSYGNADQLYNVGCLGKIEDFKKTEDGRILVNLNGLSRFEIINEIDNSKLYREFEVKYHKFRNDLSADNENIISEWKKLIDSARKDGSSLGAIIEVRASGIPAGLGEPIYDKLDSDIAKALMTINAVKGVEIGNGFECVNENGKTNVDEMIMKNGKPFFLSNNNGGVLGGISSGQEIIARFVVKPTSSIISERRTIDVNLKETSISTKGRHDPCVGIRAVPVGEAMLATTIADHCLRYF